MPWLVIVVDAAGATAVSDNSHDHRTALPFRADEIATSRASSGARNAGGPGYRPTSVGTPTGSIPDPRTSCCTTAASARSESSGRSVPDSDRPLSPRRGRFVVGRSGKLLREEPALAGTHDIESLRRSLQLLRGSTRAEAITVLLWFPPDGGRVRLRGGSVTRLGFRRRRITGRGGAA